MAANDEHTRGYVAGSIVRVKVIDFMTYDHVELFPGPHFNLIIGPNGCGKSSIASAICLGLAGTPSSISQKSVVEYIKYGKRKAFIEIELYNPEDENNIIIGREINSNGSSSFSVNGISKKEYEVAQSVSQFHIHMNNLCQFLPQEKVANFSKLSPIQLLEIMQQSVGDHSLVKSHDELKRLCNQCRELESEITLKREEISDETKQNDRIESEVHVYEELSNLNEKKKLLEEHLLLIKHEETNVELEEQKRKRQQLCNKIGALEESIDSFRNDMNLVVDVIKNYNDSIKEMKCFSTSKSKMISDILYRINALDNEICAAKKELEAKLAEHVEREAKIIECETELERTRESLRNCESAEAIMEEENLIIQQDVEEVSNKIVAVEMSMAALKKYRDNKLMQAQGLEKELQRLSKHDDLKKQALKLIDVDAYRAMLWLESNRLHFKKQIYDPIYMMLEIPNSSSIKFIENHIPIRDLTAFVCEDKDDIQKLTEELVIKSCLKVNIVQAPSRHLFEFKPPVPVDELKKYSFTCYLKDLLTAPDAIISYLCCHHNIHNIPVGSDDTEKHITYIMERKKFKTFYTPECRYSVKYSRYGACNASVMNSVLRSPQILNHITKTSDQQEVQNQLMSTQAEIQKDDATYMDFKARHTEYLCNLKEVEDRRKPFDDLKNRIKNQRLIIVQREKALHGMKQRRISKDGLEKKAADFIDGKRKEKIKHLLEVKDILKLCYEKEKEILSHQFYSMAFSKKCSLTEQKLLEREDVHKGLQVQKQKIGRCIKTLKELKRREYKDATDGCGMEINEKTTSFLRAKYNDLPHTVLDLTNEIIKVESKIDCLGEGNKTVYDEYQHRKDKISKRKGDLENFLSILQNLQEEMKVKKHLWLTPLKALIDKISNSFSKSFQSFNCAGEISLKVSEDPDDFDKYGLSIFVKFRNDAPPQELSYTHHSGGECSISTIVFILALQNLTEVPFRCIDEVNQGMDPIFERQIFDLVTSSGNSCQYFLLSPKLLSGLNFPKNMKVHIVINGPLLDENIDWRISMILSNLSLSKPSA